MLRHFCYATLAGGILGVLMASARMLADRGFDSEKALTNVALGLFSAYTMAIALMIAARVAPRRAPPWLPFVIAAVCVAAVQVPVNVQLADLTATNQGHAARQPAWITVWGHLPQDLVVALLIALGYMRGRDAWKRSATLRDLQLADMRLSREAAEAHLKTLQSRVDPQFLFDTLAAIEVRHAADSALGQQMIDRLIVYLRASLPSLDTTTSSLAAECALVRAWLEIDQSSHGERFTFALGGLSPMPAARMPAMVLQPLVQHAVDCLPDTCAGQVHVSIEAANDQGRLRVSVTTTGFAFTPAASAALAVELRERIAAVHGRDAWLTFRRFDSRSSQALLEIPHEAPDRDHR